MLDVGLPGTCCEVEVGGDTGLVSGCPKLIAARYRGGVRLPDTAGEENQLVTREAKTAKNSISS